MTENKFTYFAYGSNMLTERIKAPTRCPSATPVGIALVMGYKVMFIKESADKSGKATLVNTHNESDIVYGVLFEIDDTAEEKKRLDKAEGVSDGGYEVEDDFTVIFNDKPLNNIRTYIAPDNRCKEGLPVYDWYLALVIAGASQHKLDEAYISRMIEENRVTKYANNDRESKIEAFRILEETGFSSVFSKLKF